MNFAREVATEIFTEISPLLRKNYAETAHYQDIELKPDWQAYANLEESGCLRIFTARDDAKTLVGYAIFLVRHNIHYSDSKQAIHDVLFIDPERRGFGRSFICWCDEQLRAEGVQVVYHHVNKEHDFGVLLKRIGYQLVDMIYGRRLDQKGRV